MAARYDLRSQQDGSADNDFALLPGTSDNAHSIPYNTTQKKQAISNTERPGCNPGRWLYELTNNNFTVCDMYDRARYANIDAPFDWQHQHQLVLNGNQSGDLSPSSKVVSSVCLDCHFHFVFKLEWDQSCSDQRCNPEQAAWPHRDGLFPWHHLVWAGSEPDPMLQQYRSKYEPLVAREYFACNAPPCTFQITLDVLEPRMGSWWIQLLQDKEAILAELEKAKQLEPARYEGVSESSANDGPLNLNTYLKNLIDAPPDKIRSISKRNKRFAVVFGPRCAKIFRQLEFTSDPPDSDERSDEGVLVPKVPEAVTSPGGITMPGTYRAYLEDVRAEVQCLIHKQSLASGNPAVEVGEQPSFILGLLHTELGYYHGTPKNTDPHLIDLDRYKLLGVVPDQPKEVIVSTYYRQWEQLKTKRGELIQALIAVANDRNDEQLSNFAMMQSSVYESQLPRQDDITDDEGLVNQAIIYLGLSPPNVYAAKAIIDAYRRKIIEKPNELSTARNMLMMIAGASSSGEYQELLLTEGSGMTLDTSKEILHFSGWQNEWPDCLATGEAKITASKSQDEIDLILEALTCIADHFRIESFMTATRSLRQRYGSGASGSKDATTQQGNLALPVGLLNIGNTCYLNSLLQYLFTVKPVRDIVLNYDNYKLELKDDEIDKRRIGGNKMQMDRGEAIVAQAFVKELTDLFNNLTESDKVATRPSQRLANAVLLGTHSIIEDAKKAAAEAARESKEDALKQGPPLPPRGRPEHVRGSQVLNEDVKEVSPTPSAGSSSTLVDITGPTVEVQEDVTMRSESQLSSEEKQPTESTPLKLIDDSPVTGLPSPPAEEAAVQTQASDDGDTIMADKELPLDIDQKVLSALEHQTRSGTDQQDVEEVIGNIINRLQAAIQPGSINEQTGIQMEKIMETFFVKMVNYTKKFHEATYQSEVGFDRSITAYPAPKGRCTLYDALARNFDQQILEESKLWRYTAIQELPPILHVLIQRSSVGQKNENAVIIPETLYLDRYMDAPQDSAQFQLRKAQWAVANRIEDMKEAQDAIQAPEAKRIKLECHAAEAELQEVATFDQSFSIEGTPDIKFPDLPSEDIETSDPSETTVTYESNPEVETRIWELMEEEREQRDQKLTAELEELKEYPYRLQAVICHSGRLTSGHYWVWIHDFEDNIWRKYNDEFVEQNPDTEAVLKQLSSSGHPYYLCYVRDEDKENYVSVPKRPIPPSPPPYTELAQGDSNEAAPLLEARSYTPDTKITETPVPAEPSEQQTSS